MAVLPFRNVGPDPTQQYFADGIADAILNALARLPGVKVTARSSSFAFRGRDLDIRVIAESLGVSKIVEGSVLKSGGRIRVQASLIEAKTGFALWSETIDRTEADIFELQDTVSRAIASRLGAAAPAAGQRLVRRATESAEAHNRFLRGRDLLYRRDAASLAAAIQEFKRAIQADARYAPAYAALSAAYGLRVTLSGWTRTSRDGDSSYAWAAGALAAANRAIEMDSLLPEGFAARGYAKLYNAPPSEGTEQDLLRALQLRPGSAEAHGWYAQHLVLVDRQKEAMEAVARAVELDPVSVGMQLAYVATTSNAGDHQRALEHSRAIRILRPQVDLVVEVEALSLLRLGRAQECLELPRLLPGIDALCLQAGGRSAEAASRIAPVIDEWNQGRGDHTFRLVNIVTYYARAGQVDEAIKWATLMAERTPVSLLMWERNRMLDPGLDAEGGRLRSVLLGLRQAAWDRVRRESQTVVFP